MGAALRTAPGALGTALLVIVLMAAVVGPFVAPYDAQAFHPAARLQGPSAVHWFGTDQFGRDLLSRMQGGELVDVFDRDDAGSPDRHPYTRALLDAVPAPAAAAAC